MAQESDRQEGRDKYGIPDGSTSFSPGFRERMADRLRNLLNRNAAEPKAEKTGYNKYGIPDGSGYNRSEESDGWKKVGVMAIIGGASLAVVTLLSPSCEPERKLLHDGLNHLTSGTAVTTVKLSQP